MERAKSSIGVTIVMRRTCRLHIQCRADLVLTLIELDMPTRRLEILKVDAGVAFRRPGGAGGNASVRP